MKVGTFITPEGIEFSVEASELRELIEYLCQQEANEALSVRGDSVSTQEFVGPEDYERIIQAAWAVRQPSSGADAALTGSYHRSRNE
jgi:hypothetical protein